MTNYYATCRGKIATSSLKEIFVHSFAIISASSAQTVAQDLATTWAACLNTGSGGFPLKSLFGGSVVYDEITVAQLLNAEPPDPRLASATHVTIGPVTGTGVTAGIPSQCAVAVSMKAGTKANGVPQKGRFYLPPPATTHLDASSGLLQTDRPDVIRDTIAGWWVAMRGAGHAPALWSRTYGTVKPWDAIRVGRTVDTIRRRRNELPESYSQYVTVV